MKNRTIKQNREALECELMRIRRTQFFERKETFEKLKRIVEKKEKKFPIFLTIEYKDQTMVCTIEDENVKHTHDLSKGNLKNIIIGKSLPDALFPKKKLCDEIQKNFKEK